MWYYWAAAIAAAAFYLLGFVFFKPRDWKFAVASLKVVRGLRVAARREENTGEMWYRHLVSRPLSKPAIIFEGRVYTFGDLEEGSNRIANWLLSRGVQKDDCVALYMSNCPEFVMVWLATLKIGAVLSMLNHNTREQPLVHAMEVVNVRLVIFGSDVAEGMNTAREFLELQRIPAFVFSATDAEAQHAARLSPYASELRHELLNHTASPVPEEHTASARGTKFGDTFMYVYTSGTTGLPKAAKYNHFRWLLAASGFSQFFGIRGDDVLYCTMPLYHSAANVLAMGSMLRIGCTMVMRRKFSASRYWDDVRQHRVTVIQYIGELCRYLLHQPPNPELDSKHSVRLAFGNGLSPEIWREFKDRFGIGQIGEIYAATEGAGGLVNMEGREGAVGFISGLLSLVIAAATIVKFDRQTEQVVRNSRGFCVPCDANEPGEFLVQVRDIVKGVGNFQGYTNAADSSKKLLRDVFKKGDVYFRSGDLLRRDADGFVYFVDRIGDTFRWKGENVSTTEVSQVVSPFLGTRFEVNVYGVEVPNHGGRAGMMALSFVEGGSVDPKQVDWAGLAACVCRSLPQYARPVFVRLLGGAMRTTSTFKLQKADLRQEGCDPTRIGDPVFFLDGDKYRPLTRDVYADICGQRVRL